MRRSLFSYGKFTGTLLLLLALTCRADDTVKRPVRYVTGSSLTINTGVTFDITGANLIGFPVQSGGEPPIAAGTSAQFWRGDKTFQTLNITALSDGANVAKLDAATNIFTGALTMNASTGSAGTKLLDLQLAGVSKASVTKEGNFSTSGIINVSGATLTGSTINAGDGLSVAAANALTVSSVIGNADQANTALVLNAANSSDNIALNVLAGRSIFGGPINMSGYGINNLSNTVINGSVDTTNGSLRLADNAVWSDVRGHGGLLVLAGDTGEHATNGRAVFASVQGEKENNGYLDSRGALVFATQPEAADLAGLSTVTEKMRITSDGKVGIGTNQPPEKLTVNGRIMAEQLLLRRDQSVGRVVLTGGTYTVQNVSVATESRIFLSRSKLGTNRMGVLVAENITTGTSFEINSYQEDGYLQSADDSEVTYFIVQEW